MTVIKAAAVELSPDHEVEVSAIPITVAVLFHSGFGHTARQAEAVRRGIERVAGASALYLRQTRLRAAWMISNLQTRSSSAPRPIWEARPDRSKPSWIRRQKPTPPAPGRTRSRQASQTRRHGLATRS